MTEVLVKVLLLTLVIIILGPPIWHTAEVLMLFAAGLIAVLGSLRPATRGRVLAAFAIVAVSLGIKMTLPAIQVQEGHNMFLVDGSRHEAALRAALPPAIYHYARQTFERSYPASAPCLSQAGCWRDAGEITVPYAFTADGALQRPEMSRVVDFPYYDSVAGLRAAFVNSNGLRGLPSTNWYDFLSGPDEPTRVRMPFFVVYEIPASLTGQTICMAGDWFWLSPGAVPTHTAARARICRRIEARDVGGRLYGLSIDPRMALSVSPYLSPTVGLVAHFLRIIAAAIGALTVTLTVVRIDWSKLGLFGVVTLGPCLAAGAAQFNAAENPFFSAGTDQLTHWALGQKVLQAAVAGQWLEAARGGEDVFYFMPGLRYFHALEMLIFGDSGFLSFVVVMFYPFLLFKTAERLGGIRLAITCLPIAYAAFYFASMKTLGLAESIAYPACVVAALLLLGKPPADKTGAATAPSPANTAGAALILASVSILRPNLGLAAVLLLAGAVLWPGRRGAPARAVAALAGFAPVALMLLHNVAFGGRWVLATDASTIPDNLRAAPTVYLHALVSIASLHWKDPAIEAIFRQLGGWLGGEAGVPLLALAVLIAAAARLWGWPAVAKVIGAEWAAFEPVLLGLLLAGLELPLLFYTPSGRYAYLAGAIASILFVQVLLRFFDLAGIAWPPRALVPVTGRLISSLER